MALNKKYTVKYKRKKLGLTDYVARLKLLTSRKVRLVVRKSLNNLTGLVIGLEAKNLKIKEAVLDIGLSESLKGSSLYSLLRGALDSGLIIPHSKEILPSEDRVSGKHIQDHYNLLSQDIKNKQFSKYLKNNINPGNIVKDFQEVKNKILNKYKNG